MTRQPFSADFRSAAALDGEDLPYFGRTEEDESDESELVESTAAYGSLLGAAGGRKKKAMALVLDPVEAENEARRVRHIAGQQFGCEEALLPEGPVEPAVDPEAVAEPYAAPELDVWAEPEMVEVEPVEPEPVEVAEPVAEVPAEPEMPAAIEAAAEPAPRLAEPDDFWVFSDDDADDLPEPEAPAVVHPVPVVEAPIVVVAVPEPIMPPPPVQLVAASRPGHSLRARVPQQKQRRSFGQHLVAVIGWLAKRFSRGE